jgi:hypothetical protein
VPPCLRGESSGLEPIAAICGTLKTDGSRYQGRFRVLLHAFHAAHSGREWLLPIMLVAGMGVALTARWLARRGRLPRDDDEPV